MFRPLLICLLAVAAWVVPRTGEAAERLLLILAETGTNRSIEASFASEMALVLDEVRVALIPGKSADFQRLAENDRIGSAHAILKARGALCLVWLEASAASATSVERIGLLVHTDNGTLARTVSFENPISFIPELALITGELIAHALAFEPETQAGIGAVGKGEDAAAASTGSAQSASPSGLGSRIPAPDGWTRVPEVEASDVTGPDAETGGDAESPKPDTKTPKSDAGEATKGEKAASGEAAPKEEKDASRKETDQPNAQPGGANVLGTVTIIPRLRG